METIFADLSPMILGSPEVGNMENLELMLRVSCEMNSFQRALEICSNSKKIRGHDKLIYPFGAILKLVEQISILKTSPFETVLNIQLSVNQNVFEKAILQLKYSKHPVCSFWYDFGVNIYFDVLQKSGQSFTYDQLWKFANKIQHFSMETLVSWQSMNSCSNNSSVATVTEILEVPITNIMFYFVVFAEESIHVELSSSIKSLKTTITSCFNIPSERFTYFTNWNLFLRELNAEFSKLIP